MRRPVESPQRKVRELCFRVDGTGTAAIDFGGQHGTLTDNGTGDYTITFNDPFRLAMVAVATPIGVANLKTEIDSLSATAVRVKFTDTAESAADCEFSLIVKGADTEDET